jgi:hypothetical protein
MNRKYEVIQIEEIEYKPKEKIAEVEVKWIDENTRKFLKFARVLTFANISTYNI